MKERNIISMLNFDKAKTLDFTKNALVYVVALYVLILLGHSIWANWTLKKEVDQIKGQISTLQAQNQNLENLIVYYQSASFKDLEARSELGLKKPDEKVVSVPVAQLADIPPQTSEEEQSLIVTKPVAPLKNWQAWWSYIFK